MGVKVLGVVLLILLALAYAGAATPTIPDFNIISGVYTSNPLIDLNISGTGDANYVRYCCGTSCSGTWVPLPPIPTYVRIDDLNVVSDVNGCASTSQGTVTVRAEMVDINQNINNIASATDTIIYDRTGPITTSDKNYYISGSSFTVTLTCADYPASANSGCATTLYSLNGAAPVAGTTINITVDGNYTIDFNSVDNLGNSDLNRRAYVARDGVAPTITVTTSTTQTIKFDINNSLTDINLNSIHVDINGARSTDFNFSTGCANIYADKNRYSCSYDENKLNKTGDFNVAVFASDLAGNLAQKDAIFARLDQTAPGTPATPTITYPSALTIKLDWVANLESDVNGYRIYRIGGAIANPYQLAFDTNSQAHIGRTGSTTYSDTNVIADYNYWYRIIAFDYSDNNSAASSSTSRAIPTAAGTLSAPSVSSSTHPSTSAWYSADDITVSWGAVSGATNYSWSIDSNSGTDPGNTSDGNVLTASYTDYADGTWYFHIKATNGSSWGSVAHFTINIDKAAPAIPADLSASANADGAIALSWSAASDTGGSGIYGYEIYRGTSSAFSVGTAIATATSTSYTDAASNLSAGTVYYYKIKAKDNAGNLSSLSSEASATAKAPGGIAITITVPKYAKAGAVAITVSAGGGNMQNATLQVKTYGKDYETVASGKSGASFSASYTVDEGEDGIATARVTATDASGGNYDVTQNFEVDTAKPDVNLLAPLNNAELEGDANLLATATDKGTLIVSGIKQVTFYYRASGASNWTNIAIAVASGNSYSAEWDTTDVNNGAYEVKAIASDNAGNATDSQTAKVSVKNAPSEKSSTENEISDADSGKAAVEGLVEELQALEIELPDELALKKQWADANLAKAKVLLAAKDYAAAKALAENAATLYADLSTGISTIKFTNAIGRNAVWIVLGIVVVIVIALLYLNYARKNEGALTSSEGLHRVRAEKPLGERISGIFRPKEQEKAPRWAFKPGKK
ncbi:MAG: hypothetical protein HYW05_05030 [Candidatus Diapherotrites archaeon]|nr:hypothetical protein [Candidatus Diapherotrites archaeon]